MKTFETEMQLALFAAAGTAFAALKRLDPADPEALAGIGLVVTALAPTYEEMWAYALENGLEKPDPKAYAAMLAAAQGFAATVAGLPETSH